MKKNILLYGIVLLLLMIGSQFAHEAESSSTTNQKDKPQYPLPLSVDALIPRHATIVWHSVIYGGSFDKRDVAVLYSTPLIGANDSLKYLELFIVDEAKSATPRDRIYLGGRGLYVVDKVSEQDHRIIVHSRRHQNDDAICCPTRH